MSVQDLILKLNVVETPTEWILMCDSPAGGATTRVPAPFTAEELTSSLHDLETSLIRSYSKVVTRRTVSPEVTALRFGNRLADVLLDGEVRVFFEECRRRARESGGHVRVLLETDGQTVSQIPWEFAVDPRARDDYLALRLSLARHLRVSAPVPPLSVKPPLRVLGVHSHPHDLPTLAFEEEQQSVAALESVSSDLVQVTWLEGDRWSDLSDALGEGGWHVLHFVGHGGFNEETDSGYLELSDDSGAALSVAAARIGAAAANSGDIRLVVLNACESATTGAAGAFSSTAAKLMREGIPAVVAMQYEITDPAALAFAAGFYEAMARGNPVDRAVTKAREIVRVTQNSLEWATPVLFLASDETRLFEVVEPPKVAPPASALPQQGGPQQTGTQQTGTQPSVQQGGPVQQSGGVPQIGSPSGQRAALVEPESTWQRGLAARVNDWLKGSSPRDPVEAQPPRRGGAPGPSTPPPAPTPTSDAAKPPAPRTVQAQKPAQKPAQTPAPQLDPELPRLERLSVTTTQAPCRRVALGPGNLLAMACTDGTVRVWNVRTGRWAAHCNLAAGVQARSLAWSPWPRHVASGHDDGTVVVWDLEREVPLRFLRPECNGIASMCFSNNGKWLAVVGLDRTVQVFDAQGQTRRRFRVPAAPAQVAWSQAPKRVGPSAFAPGDRHLVVAANDGAVVEIDPHGRVHTTWPNAQAVCGLALSANRLATCSVDGRLRFWLWEGHHVRRQQGARIEHMEFASGGEFLATAAIDHRLTSWSPDGEVLGAAVLEGRPAGVGVGDGFIVTAGVGGVLEKWTTGLTPATNGKGDDD